MLFSNILTLYLILVIIVIIIVIIFDGRCHRYYPSSSSSSSSSSSYSTVVVVDHHSLITIVVVVIDHHRRHHRHRHHHRFRLSVSRNILKILFMTSLLFFTNIFYSSFIALPLTWISSAMDVVVIIIIAAAFPLQDCSSPPPYRISFLLVSETYHYCFCSPHHYYCFP